MHDETIETLIMIIILGLVVGCIAVFINNDYTHNWKPYEKCLLAKAATYCEERNTILETTAINAGNFYFYCAEYDEWSKTKTHYVQFKDDMLTDCGKKI